MRVLYVTSEVFPLLKTGGLADVSAALPAALNDLGIDTRILMPAYRQALARASQVRVVAQLGDLLGCGEARLLETQLPDTGVPVWMVDCPALYDRSGGAYQDEQGNDWQDNALRFALLSRVAALLPDAPIAGTWRPDILHVHDWHAALVPLMMAGRGGSPTVLTIHNLAYQGSFPLDTLGRLGLDQRQAYRALEFHGRLCFLKAGIAWADALTTVSPTYAEEILTPEYGCGLEGILRARSDRPIGIMNGAGYRVWDPAHDPHLAHPYSCGNLAAKRACKIALQQEMGLDPAPDRALIAFTSRLAHQKMPDIVLDALPSLLAQGVQFALVAEGQADYEAGFRELAAHHPGRVSVRIGYQEPQAHRLLAGADILLHPARYEPCGLVPIYAMRYGTLPIVRRTGGMADSVVDAIESSIHCENATGFAFDSPTADDLIACVHRALALYEKPTVWRRIQSCAMRRDFGWQRPTRAYVDLYRTLTVRSAAAETDLLLASEVSHGEAQRPALARIAA